MVPTLDPLLQEEIQIKNTPLIAFCGGNQVGKTTCSVKMLNFLRDKGYVPYFCNFADKFKKFIQDLYGYDSSIFDDPNKYLPEARMTLRELMIVIGQELKPHLGEDIWVKALSNQIRYAFTLDSWKTRIKRVIVVGDLRFDAEYNWIREHKFNSIISVIHPSRNDGPKEVPYVDYIIKNDGGIEELNERIQIIGKQILQERWPT